MQSLKPKQVGMMLAERLGLKILGTEGHDLKCACVSCDSSDAARVHQDTGVFFCFSCKKALSAWDLCKVALGDHDQAKRLMVEVGLFEDRPEHHKVNGQSALAAALVSAPIPNGDILEAVAKLKCTTADALRMYGAEIDAQAVYFPMYGPDGQQCSAFQLTADGGKGLYAPGKPVGLFLPGRTPQPGETWLEVEGVKDASALSTLGHLAAGLPSNRLPEKFAGMFQDVAVIVMADGDKPGRDGAQTTAELLDGIAASVKVCSFPDGMDARDVIKRDGPEGIERAIRGAKLSGVDYELITAAECLRRNYPLEYLIKGVLAKGEPVLVCAPLKACKTLLAADMAIALVKGGFFLGYFPVPRPVPTMMLWGESGWRGVQTNIRRIGMAAGATDADFENLFVGVKLPKFGSPAHARALDQEIKRRGVEVVIIDCLYLCGVSGDSSRNQFDMGELLKSIGDVFVQNDCTLVLLHHTTKHIAVGEPLQLDNSAFAGTAEYAAQWLLINRQKLFQPGSGHHDLWLTIGGRAGHGGLYGVTIDEGQFIEGQDRAWVVQVLKPEEMRRADQDGKEEAREAKRLEKIQDDKVRICRAMAALERQHPEGNAVTSIRDRSGIKGQRLQDSLSALLNDGAAVECEFLRSNHKTPRQGYKLKTETETENQ